MIPRVQKRRLNFHGSGNHGLYTPAMVRRRWKPTDGGHLYARNRCPPITKWSLIILYITKMVASAWGTASIAFERDPFNFLWTLKRHNSYNLQASKANVRWVDDHRQQNGRTKEPWTPQFTGLCVGLCADDRFLKTTSLGPRYSTGFSSQPSNAAIRFLQVFFPNHRAKRTMHNWKSKLTSSYLLCYQSSPRR